MPAKITVRLDDTADARLTQIAAERGVTKSAAALAAILAMTDDDFPGAKRLRARIKPLPLGGRRPGAGRRPLQVGRDE